jgi:hypothetical protein
LPILPTLNIWFFTLFRIIIRNIRWIIGLLFAISYAFLGSLQATLEAQTGISLTRIRSSLSYWVLTLFTWVTVSGTIAFGSMIILSAVSPLQTWFLYSTVLGMGELSAAHVHQQIPVYFVWHHFHLERDSDFASLSMHEHTGLADLQLPRASVHLAPLGRIANSLLYSLTLFLTLPESTVNINIGTFTVRLDLFDAAGTLLETIHRSAVLHYKSTLVQRLQGVLHGIPLLVGLGSRFEEKQTVAMHFLENYRFDEEFGAIEWLNLTISHPQIQIYDAELHLEAQLSGLRYYFYHWFWTTYILVTIAIFWLDMTVLFVFALGLTVRQWWRRTQQKSEGGTEAANKGKEDEREWSERERERVATPKLRVEHPGRLRSPSSPAELDDTGAGVLSLFRAEDLSSSSDSNDPQPNDTAERSPLDSSPQSSSLRLRQKSDT